MDDRRPLLVLLFSGVFGGTGGGTDAFDAWGGEKAAPCALVLIACACDRSVRISSSYLAACSAVLGY